MVHDLCFRFARSLHNACLLKMPFSSQKRSSAGSPYSVPNPNCLFVKLIRSTYRFRSKAIAPLVLPVPDLLEEQ